MDAGCNNEEVVAHCRSEGPYVRGCWVVDLLLGKECAMTEQEWLACTEPAAMFKWLHSVRKAERRQLGLFFAACCSRIRPSIVEERSKRTNYADWDDDPIALTEAQFHMLCAITEALRAIENSEYAPLAALLRDIVGNPFRPVTLDPRWLTSTVMNLATEIYTEKTLDRMPILADALVDAGCDDEEIIAHCRDDGPHVRGCWVLGLLLGKE
jgi:hypothetical protein